VVTLTPKLILVIVRIIEIERTVCLVEQVNLAAQFGQATSHNTCDLVIVLPLLHDVSLN
jgi:hypothetical protein